MTRTEGTPDAEGHAQHPREVGDPARQPGAVRRHRGHRDTHHRARVEPDAKADQARKRCNGKTEVAGLIDDLERSFGAAHLSNDVYEFLTEAARRGWIEFAH